jgi:hypothetical protein
LSITSLLSTLRTQKSHDQYYATPFLQLSGREHSAYAVSGWKYNEVGEDFAMSIDVDYTGGDIFDFPVPDADSLFLCVAACRKQGEKAAQMCAAFSFYRAGTFEGECWLKGTATPLRLAPQRVDNVESVAGVLTSLTEAALLDSSAYLDAPGKVFELQNMLPTFDAATKLATIDDATTNSDMCRRACVGNVKCRSYVKSDVCNLYSAQGSALKAIPVGGKAGAAPKPKSKLVFCGKGMPDCPKGTTCVAEAGGLPGPNMAAICEPTKGAAEAEAEAGAGGPIPVTYGMITDDSVQMMMLPETTYATDASDTIVKQLTGDECRKKCMETVAPMCVGFAFSFNPETLTTVCELKHKLVGGETHAQKKGDAGRRLLTAADDSGGSAGVSGAISGSGSDSGGASVGVSGSGSDSGGADGTGAMVKSYTMWKFALESGEYDFDIDVDYNGGNKYDGPATKALDPFTCMDYCTKLASEKSEGCAAFTFYRSGPYAGDCWIKTLATAEIPAATYVPSIYAVSGRRLAVSEKDLLAPFDKKKAEKKKEKHDPKGFAAEHPGLLVAILLAAGVAILVLAFFLFKVSRNYKEYRGTVELKSYGILDEQAA